MSNRLVSLIMAQIAENKELSRVFEDLFDAEGAEIYLKPADDFVALLSRTQTRGGRTDAYGDAVVESAKHR